VQWPVQRVLQITVYHRITGWLCHWRTTSTVPQESEILLTSISGMFVYVQTMYLLPKVILHAYNGFSSIEVPVPDGDDEQKQETTRTQQES